MNRDSTHARARTVMDRAREPWTVEQVSTAAPGRDILRYRHELGYELAVAAPRPLEQLDEEELTRLLEEVRHYSPRREAGRSRLSTRPRVADAA